MFARCLHALENNINLFWSCLMLPWTKSFEIQKSTEELTVFPEDAIASTVPTVQQLALKCHISSPLVHGLELL